MTGTEIREALRELAAEIDSFAESRDSSAQTCIGFTAEDCRPALSALAGMCVLPVGVVRVLVTLTDRAHGYVTPGERAALAAAEAEVERAESTKEEKP